jgi:hypothetical protein
MNNLNESPTSEEEKERQRKANAKEEADTIRRAAEQEQIDRQSGGGDTTSIIASAIKAKLERGEIKQIGEEGSEQGEGQ